MIRTVRAIIISLACGMLFCAAQEKSKPEPCLPLSLTAINSSEYVLKHLYMHDAPDYRGSAPIADAVDPNTALPLAIAENDTKYFTFIRTVTSSSSIDIAVTTARPLTFSKCHRYTLYILEEDFYIQQEPPAARSDDDQY